MGYFSNLFGKALEEAFRSFYRRPTASEVLQEMNPGDSVIITVGDYPSSLGTSSNGNVSTFRVFPRYNPLDPEYFAEIEGLQVIEIKHD